MSIALPTAPVVRFHLSLNVSDLGRTVAFYRILFNREPAKLRPDYAKFEPDEPPLVLSLEPNGRPGPGTLNHLGLRLSDMPSLVAMQERLERAGIHSQREDGVECCYAKQTKFWVTDPDGTLWELYVLEDDLDHRGVGQSRETMIDAGGAVWEHRLGEPIPVRLGFADRTLDEVRLRGSFNVRLSPDECARLLAEVRRTLKPNGRLVVRNLTGDEEVMSPGLGGPAALVQFVPTKDALVAALGTADFPNVRVTKYGDPPCFVKNGVAMRETHIEAWTGAGLQN